MNSTFGRAMVTALLLLCPFVHAEIATDKSAKGIPVYRELFRKGVKDTDGQTITYVRIEKPNLPKLPLPPAPPPPTPEQLADEARRAAKDYIFISVSATVFLDKHGVITELRWRENDKDFLAYSNVDFRYLSQITDIETERHIINWFPFVGSCEQSDMSAEEWSKVVPKVKFNRKLPEYVVDTTEAEMKQNESAFTALDAVHAYYEINADSLRKNYLRMEEDERKRQEELLRNPPKKPDTVIHFWPIKSGLNLEK